ncbi:hypothetical protein Patl1_09899 [Pistacia atlantica]|uniref:Uncharacterized protein n=1 Tax=Pistacia atlantica TaxID=434234 RepID=A0ACC1A3G9_9ROSI|nr:hypothetical protein Patl1_09899 [Pistacia atlantica]
MGRERDQNTLLGWPRAEWRLPTLLWGVGGLEGSGSGSGSSFFLVRFIFLR